MRDRLAEQLLAAVMGWTAEDVARERPYLQAMAALKYDHYNQFSPGIRFVESLALWLQQFESEPERRVAYHWVRHKLIFVSSPEMSALASLSFSQLIRPWILKLASRESGMPEYMAREIAQTQKYRSLLRQTLFLGLSDGARLDLFRRFNPEISHEQVSLTYDIPPARADEMLEKLNRDLGKIFSDLPATEDARFRFVVLMDDFSASGLSYIRTEDGEYCGKIPAFFKTLDRDNQSLIGPDTKVAVVIYVVSERAQEYLEKALISYQPRGRAIVIKTLQQIDSRLCVDQSSPEMIPLLEKYFDPVIVDRHYKKGRHERPYLGFDECSLPLVLQHNSPNNSVPLLWFGDGCRYHGLFPRVSRHKP